MGQKNTYERASDNSKWNKDTGVLCTIHVTFWKMYSKIKKQNTSTQGSCKDFFFNF